MSEYEQMEDMVEMDILVGVVMGGLMLLLFILALGMLVSMCIEEGPCYGLVYACFEWKDARRERRKKKLSKHKVVALTQGVVTPLRS